jgi:50S ribosomal subunit-associated GTPase HflX
MAIGVVDGREDGEPLAELKELLRTAGVATAGEATQQRPRPAAGAETRNCRRRRKPRCLR